MSNKRILLVEDEPVIQKLYLDLLTAENYSIETASDGKEAYKKMRQGGWDLVLLDLMLPSLNGIEIIKKLKSRSSQKPIKKIVFLTNLDRGKEIDQITKLGYEYLIKSNLTPDEFIKNVKSFI